MNFQKNDKIIVLIGIVILIISSIGIYLWAPPEDMFAKAADIDDIVTISGVFSNLPNAIEVSDESPFYALIATPIAIHYDEDIQNVIPLYVKNFEEPSNAIIRAKDMIGIPVDLTIGRSFDVTLCCF